jgi:two-component system sensor histidine kinase CpxA
MKPPPRHLPLASKMGGWLLLNLALLAVGAWLILRANPAAPQADALVLAAGGAMVLSILFWLPFAFALTRQLQRMAAATSKIAGGNFDLRLSPTRDAEFEEIAQSVNTMASQLHALVRGQKRFLGDVAHELCSPVSRMQAALALLEDGAKDAETSRYLTVLREELDDMSGLIGELLQFSKAGSPREIALQTVSLASLVARVVAREAAGVTVKCDIPDTLTVQTEPALLSRALGNVLRNAIRYAGGAGPIIVSAAPEQGGIALVVADSGRGVPSESLPRLFDAFYRPDPARERESGGTGLGLAIVKTCVEACGGRVAARNRLSSGLEVVFALPGPARA